MRRSSNALLVDEDEVPVMSNELIETHIATIRAQLGELKVDFGAAIARLDKNIREVGSKLEADIRALAARADHDIRALAAKVENDLRDLRADNKSLREKVDANHYSLTDKIDALRDKMDSNQADSIVKFDSIRDSLADMRALQKAMLWVIGLTAGAIIAMIAKGLHLV